METSEIKSIAQKFAEVEFGFDLFTADEIQTCSEVLRLLDVYANTNDEYQNMQGKFVYVNELIQILKQHVLTNNNLNPTTKDDIVSLIKCIERG